MEIFVETLTCMITTVTFEVDPSESIDKVKQKILVKKGSLQFKSALSLWKGYSKMVEPLPTTMSKNTQFYYIYTSKRSYSSRSRSRARVSVKDAGHKPPKPPRRLLQSCSSH